MYNPIFILFLFNFFLYKYFTGHTFLSYSYLSFDSVGFLSKDSFKNPKRICNSRNTLLPLLAFEGII